MTGAKPPRGLAADSTSARGTGLPTADLVVPNAPRAIDPGSRLPLTLALEIALEDWVVGPDPSLPPRPARLPADPRRRRGLCRTPAVFVVLAGVDVRERRSAPSESAHRAS